MIQQIGHNLHHMYLQQSTQTHETSHAVSGVFEEMITNYDQWIKCRNKWDTQNVRRLTDKISQLLLSVASINISYSFLPAGYKWFRVWEDIDLDLFIALSLSKQQLISNRFVGLWNFPSGWALLLINQQRPESLNNLFLLGLVEESARLVSSQSSQWWQWMLAWLWHFCV